MTADQGKFTPQDVISNEGLELQLSELSQEVL